MTTSCPFATVFVSAFLSRFLSWSWLTFNVRQKMQRVKMFLNRTAVLTLPLVGVVSMFLTMVAGYRLKAADAAPSAIAFGADTFLLVAGIVGGVIVACDCIIPKRRGAIFGAMLFCAVLLGAIGWIVGSSAMHI
jgi:uncharacterized membrane protein